MKTFFKSFFDLFIYSNVWIAIGVTLFTLESYILTGQEINTNYLFLIFWSTILIYSLHRIIGISHIKEDKFAGRFIMIRSLTGLLKAIALISVLCVAYNSFKIPFRMVLVLIPAGIFSMLYVLPIFGSKRMRDFHFIKIFLIAFVWAYCCGLIPSLGENGSIPGNRGYLLFLEKFIFILAITLPFDVRDIEIDKFENVKTLVSVLGIKNTYKLSYILLMTGMIILAFGLLQNGTGVKWIIGSVLSYGLTLTAVFISRNKKSDYYFSGMLDGTIAIRSAILILFSFIQ